MGKAGCLWGWGNGWGDRSGRGGGEGRRGVEGFTFDWNLLLALYRPASHGLTGQLSSRQPGVSRMCSRRPRVVKRGGAEKVIQAPRWEGYDSMRRLRAGTGLSLGTGWKMGVDTALAVLGTCSPLVAAAIDPRQELCGGEVGRGVGGGCKGNCGESANTACRLRLLNTNTPPAARPENCEITVQCSGCRAFVQRVSGRQEMFSAVKLWHLRISETSIAHPAARPSPDSSRFSRMSHLIARTL